MTSLIIASTLLIPLFLVTSCGQENGTARNELPDEIKQFQKDRDLCDHFRGEDGYDQERRKFLHEQMKVYCTGSDDKLRKFRIKYQNNKDVVESLKKYEDRIE